MKGFLLRIVQELREYDETSDTVPHGVFNRDSVPDCSHTMNPTENCGDSIHNSRSQSGIGIACGPGRTCTSCCAGDSPSRRSAWKCEQQTFFEDSDYQAYVGLTAHWCTPCSVKILPAIKSSRETYKKSSSIPALLLYLISKPPSAKKHSYPTFPT
jgi:hypothetical protein